ncbi:MAG: DoxX family protein [Bacteroidota bacterium]
MAVTASSNVNQRIVEKRHYWIEGLRIFLGALLLYKGYYFVENLSLVYDYIDVTMPVNAFVVSHYVVFAHLAGGLMIIFGMLTRIAVLAQMPIVILGAIYYTGEGSTFFGPTTELEYSLLILVLLIVFFFYGAGKCSVDHYILRRRQADEEESREKTQEDEVECKSEEEKKKNSNVSE